MNNIKNYFVSNATSKYIDTDEKSSTRTKIKKYFRLPVFK